jgi:hypothetical protein
MTTSTATTTSSRTVPLVPLAEGTLILYTYERTSGTVTVVGTKGPEVNPGYNGGYRILDLDGNVIATVTRHAMVTVLS